MNDDRARSPARVRRVDDEASGSSGCGVRSRNGISGDGDPGPRGAADLHLVHPGESIQAAVDAARPGDTVLVLPGTYKGSVHVTTPDVTLRGTTAGLTVLMPATAQSTTVPAPSASAPATAPSSSAPAAAPSASAPVAAPGDSAPAAAPSASAPAAAPGDLRSGGCRRHR